MKYDWKVSNPKSRYIDSMTKDEIEKIAYLATGKPDNFEVLRFESTINGNNIPHIKIYVKFYEPILCEDMEDVVGIFQHLNTYRGKFHSCYCQKEIFEAYKEMGLE